eukprot:430383-Prymnesium_polylepis.1
MMIAGMRPFGQVWQLASPSEKYLQRACVTVRTVADALVTRGQPAPARRPAFMRLAGPRFQCSRRDAPCGRAAVEGSSKSSAPVPHGDIQRFRRR